MITHGQKDLWIRALKGGKYEQGTGTLWNEDTDTYCCLGVYMQEIFGKCFNLPNGVSSYKLLAQELGIPNVRTLVNLNDHPTCMSFSDIAEWIKENVAAV